MSVPASSTASGAYGVSAGLDVLSGVLGYLAAQEGAVAARSHADLVRAEAEANAQRYAEQAEQFGAHQKVMFLASGVKLAGSPVDVLATTARVANENLAAIRMAGETQALDSELQAKDLEAKGRAALMGGISKGLGMGFKSYGAANDGIDKDHNAGLGAMADLLGGGG